jgi:hypothetical protein
MLVFISGLTNWTSVFALTNVDLDWPQFGCLTAVAWVYHVGEDKFFL